MRFITGLAVTGLVTSAVAEPLPASSSYEPPKPMVASKPLQDLVKSDGLVKNLKELDKIAKANGGNRAFGLPGYAASVEYILSQIKQSKDYVTWTQDFPALFNQVVSLSFTAGGENVTTIALQYSPSTSVEGVTAPLVLGPAGEAGCSVDGYSGIDAKGKIVLVERGTCPDATTLAGKLKAAAKAGAISVVIYNNVETPVTGGTLSSPNPEEYVPGGFINQGDGIKLADRLKAGEAIEAFFQQTQIFETRITQNIFTETKGGDPHNVVMLGAHLDSVQAGAGINDDGSGTTLILEIKKALEHFKTKNKVRFAWWGAEENGLLGSKAYVASLNTTARNDILTYLNFDMVARGYFGVFDGDGSTHGLAGAKGSDTIEKLFVEDMTKKGINVTAARFTGGSDYQSFMNIGKPVGGLHTGTGPEQDPCYHQACDTIENPNAMTLTVNAKAAAHVLSILATKGTELIPQSPQNATLSARSLYPREEIQWSVMEGDKHLATCGHDI